MKGYIMEWAGLYLDAVSHFLDRAREEKIDPSERLVCYNMAARIASLLGMKDLVADIAREVNELGEDLPLKGWIKASIAGYLRVAGRTGKLKPPPTYTVGDVRFTVDLLSIGIRVRGYIENFKLESVKEPSNGRITEDYVIIRGEVKGFKSIAFISKDGALDIRVSCILESSEEGLEIAAKAVQTITEMVKA
ncbi:MAG: hypothetical protein DRN81_03300 [Thermoproteota archaeon]|nr:MAG: hypothetical protein DRN81_03300 [Candidatus Korarchaeota archaeon]